MNAANATELMISLGVQARAASALMAKAPAATKVAALRALASLLGLKSSDYIRQAVREKNEQVMAQRMAMLSKALSADHLSLNESLGDSLEDGLH